MNESSRASVRTSREGNETAYGSNTHEFRPASCSGNSLASCPLHLLGSAHPPHSELPSNNHDYGMLLAGPQGFQCLAPRVTLLTVPEQPSLTDGPSWTINCTDRDKDTHVLLAQRLQPSTLPSPLPGQHGSSHGFPFPLLFLCSHSIPFSSFPICCMSQKAPIIPGHWSCISFQSWYSRLFVGMTLK